MSSSWSKFASRIKNLTGRTGNVEQQKASGKSKGDIASALFHKNPKVNMLLHQRMRKDCPGFYDASGTLIQRLNIHEYGSIELEMYANECPVTVYNFLSLCSRRYTMDAQRPQDVLHRAVGEGIFEHSLRPQLDYRGSIMHRIIKDFGIQGGDIVANDGTSQNSVFGESFRAAKEIRDFPQDTEGLIVTASSSPDTIGSQFFILTKSNDDQKYSLLNGSCVWFGKVTSGIDILRKLEEEALDFEKRPKNIDIFIKECEVTLM